jgi:hypothetical protein
MTMRQIAAVMTKIEIRTYNKIAIGANMLGNKMPLRNPYGEETIVEKPSEDPVRDATINNAISKAQSRKKEEMKRRGR